jgi:hypothetical protein
MSAILTYLAGYPWLSIALITIGAFVVILFIILLVAWLFAQLPRFQSHIPLHEAARRAYEAIEKAGVVDVIFSPTTTAETKLNHFKLLFVVDAETELFGVRPPSTQSLLIPKSGLEHLYPSDGEVSELSTGLALDSPTYINVTVRRKDLRRVIDGHINEAKQYAK